MSASQVDRRGVARLAPYASRIVLTLAALLLARIGSRYVIDPVNALKPDGIVLHSANAMTVARVGLGAFPLAIAIFALGSVFVSRALTVAVSVIATVMATALVVRIVDIAAHGGAIGNPGPLVGESVFLAFSLIALIWSLAARTLDRSEATA